MSCLFPNSAPWTAPQFAAPLWLVLDCLRTGHCCSVKVCWIKQSPSTVWNIFPLTNNLTILSKRFIFSSVWIVETLCFLYTLQMVFCFFFHLKSVTYFHSRYYFVPSTCDMYIFSSPHCLNNCIKYVGHILMAGLPAKMHIHQQWVGFKTLWGRWFNATNTKVTFTHLKLLCSNSDCMLRTTL